MTLVEVVMAVALLGIMTSGIFGSFRYGFFTLQLVRENQRATQIILEKVETIRLYNWDQVNLNGFIPTTPFTCVFVVATWYASMPPALNPYSTIGFPPFVAAWASTNALTNSTQSL